MAFKNQETQVVTEGVGEPAKPGVIRPELNVEKWPGAWAPGHAGVSTTRILRREETLPDGAKRSQEVHVPFVSGVGTLTTDDKKTYYALVKVWEDRGRQAESLTPLSVYELAKIRRLAWSGRTHQELVASLFRLRDVPIRFVDAFVTKDGQGSTRRITQTVNLLNTLILRERSNRRAAASTGS